MTLWRRLFGRGELDRRAGCGTARSRRAVGGRVHRSGYESSQCAPQGRRAVWRARPNARGLPRSARDALARGSGHGPSLRPSNARAQPHVHGRGRVVAGPGHRGQHGHLHAGQQPVAPHAAGARARTPGAARRRLDHQPDLGADPEPPAAAVPWGHRLVGSAVRHVAGGRGQACGGAVGKRRVLRRAGRQGDPRQDVHDRERSARRRRRLHGRGDQPRLLAAPVRRRSRRHRPDHQSQQGAVHDHRRDAARVHGTPDRARVRCRRPGAHGRRPRQQRRRAAPGRPFDVVAQHHRAAQARADAGAGHGRPPGRAAADPRGDDAHQLAGGAPEGIPARGAHVVHSVAGPLVPAQSAAAATDDDHDRRLAGAVDRVRQHRQPDARAGQRTAARADDAPGAGRVARASGAPAADGKSAAVVARCGPGSGVRAVGECAAGLAVLHVARAADSRPVARLARARVHRRHRGVHGVALRRGARDDHAPPRADGRA